MAAHFVNNPIGLRQCILYEVLGGIPVFDAWKNMCRRIGDDVIDYIDYEFWYYRFLNGNVEIDYDRSLEPEQLTLNDIPVEMVARILENLELMERLDTRNVSKSLRDIIDTDVAPGFKSINVFIGKSTSRIEYDAVTVTYRNQQNDVIVENGNRKKSIENSVHDELACRDLLNILRNPKLKLENLKFEITVSDETWKFFENFEKLKNRIRVETFRIGFKPTGVFMRIERNQISRLKFLTNVCVPYLPFHFASYS